MARTDEAGGEAWELSFAYFREHRAYMTRLKQEFGLAPLEMHALRALVAEQPLTMARLSQRIYSENSNATPVVDRLVARGLVRREPDAADRRVVSIALTPPGEKMGRRIADAFREPHPLIAALSPADRRALRDLLTKMLASATPDPSDPGGDPPT